MNPVAVVRLLADFVERSAADIDALVADGHFVAAILLARLRIRAASCAFLIAEAESVIHTERPKETVRSVGNALPARIADIIPLAVSPLSGPASGVAAPGPGGFTC